MPKCDVHANWLKLMQFCQKAGHGEMTLTFADGVPVFAKTVMVQMRFGAVHGGPRPEGIDTQVLDRQELGAGRTQSFDPSTSGRSRT